MATARDRSSLLAGVPAPAAVCASRVAGETARGPRVIVLDDDPTGTQTVTNIPIVTHWALDDLRWAFGQDAPGFYILTNTRSLDPASAAQRNREVLEAVWAIAEEEQVAVSIISRSDSTLRGHFPLETDVL